MRSFLKGVGQTLNIFPDPPSISIPSASEIASDAWKAVAAGLSAELLNQHKLLARKALEDSLSSASQAVVADAAFAEKELARLTALVADYDESFGAAKRFESALQEARKYQAEAAKSAASSGLADLINLKVSRSPSGGFYIETAE